MANRDNHYEAAFEEYLRGRGVPYVAVDEAKRSVLSDGGSIKSLDFIVSAPCQVTWLVDVEGPQVSQRRHSEAVLEELVHS